MLSPIRLSVTRVDQSKMVEVRIMQFSLYSSLIQSSLLFLWDKFHPEILKGSPRAGASNKGGYSCMLCKLNPLNRYSLALRAGYEPARVKRNGFSVFSLQSSL